jgi:hypothetical protein
MKMVAGMKDRNWTICVMGMASFIIKKVVFIKEDGRKIICMDLVGYTILIINWHMRVIGLSINSMGMVKYIMMNQALSMVASITPTSTK